MSPLRGSRSPAGAQQSSQNLGSGHSGLYFSNTGKPVSDHDIYHKGKRRTFHHHRWCPHDGTPRHDTHSADCLYCQYLRSFSETGRTVYAPALCSVQVGHQPPAAPVLLPPVETDGTVHDRRSVRVDRGSASQKPERRKRRVVGGVAGKGLIGALVRHG